ncbi:metal-dependent transcriptional regulator [Streptomyces sp. NBC_00258]|uniref:metal-dependent transcriptional regulator n=1 Tax=Streptomyces sp. NBC_00258 TaxID=2903642 RepID=UPI002E2E421C|nr:metal-dependent transcriptional regulator [Streptomyces sp. NBC_00258]
MSVESVSSVAQDYMKAIWTLGEWSSGPVTTKRLAERLTVRMSTVSEQVRRLTEAGLLAHERYGAIELTAAGRLLAVGMVRRHRLIETFLVNHLGYAWDEVHDEAELLEHAVSDLLIERLDALLGYPRRDPHGDPIPDGSGALPSIPARSLTEMESGECAVVVRISDEDATTLRRFTELGLNLDVIVSVERRLASRALDLKLGADPGIVRLEAAEVGGVWVRPLDGATGFPDV